jgi:hypothetical protein
MAHGKSKEWFVKRCREYFLGDDDIQMDPDPEADIDCEGGAWVQVWAFVPDDEDYDEPVAVPDEQKLASKADVESFLSDVGPSLDW